MNTLNKTLKQLAIAILVCALSHPAGAEIFPVANPDFELGSPGTPSMEPGGVSYIGNIPGWNVVNAGGVFEPNFVSELAYPQSVQAITGDYIAYSLNNGFGLVTQFIPNEVLDEELIYILTVDVGHRMGSTFTSAFGIYRLTNPFPTGVSLQQADDPGEGNFTRQTMVLNGSDIPTGDLGNPFRIGMECLPGSIGDFDNVQFEIVRPGDVNLDGTVNLLDVEDFVDRIGSGEFQQEADINRDGLVNLLDVNPFIALLSGG